MNDAFGVASVQPIGDLYAERQQGFSFQRTPRNAVLQRQPVQKLHGDEPLAFVLTDFVDGANIGMVQGRSRPSLAAEAFQRLWVSRDILGKEFERHKSAERGVFGLVDHTHATSAQPL